MIFEAKVIRVDGARVSVICPALAGSTRIGPLPGVEVYRWEGDSLVVGYQVGDRVLIGQIAAERRYYVLGRVQ